jgi:hypothetical protein
MMTPQGLQNASSQNSLARLGIITNGIIGVYIVFRVGIAGCRRVPVSIQGQRICSSCMDRSNSGFAPYSSALRDEPRNAQGVAKTENQGSELKGRKWLSPCSSGSF